MDDYLLHRRRNQTIKRYIKAQKEVNLLSAVKWTIENASQWIKYKPEINRRINSSNDIFISKPVKRYSRDNLNCYNLWIDNNKLWENFPKRSKSFICSYKGIIMPDTFIVIPKNDAKFGSFNISDIYVAFQPYIIDIESLFDDMANEYTKYFKEQFNDINYKTMIIQITKLENYLKKHTEINNIIENRYFSIIKGEGNWINKLNFMMNPDLNDIKVKNIKELLKNKENTEIWTESECLFLHKNHYNDFIELLNSWL